jgi:hypothetical protein
MPFDNAFVCRVLLLWELALSCGAAEVVDLVQQWQRVHHVSVVLLLCLVDAG